jgi:hypothetical protein
MFVQTAQAAAPDTLRALWSVVSSHGSIADSVQGWINPADPLYWLTRERDATIRSRRMWMLRVVDAPAAIAARGFPPAVSMRATLIIMGQSCPANSGTWLLTVAGGKGELAATGTASATGTALTLGPRGMAALYAGTPVASLRLAGLAAGGDPETETDAALDAALPRSPRLHTSSTRSEHGRQRAGSALAGSSTGPLPGHAGRDAGRGGPGAVSSERTDVQSIGWSGPA